MSVKQKTKAEFGFGFCLLYSVNEERTKWDSGVPGPFTIKTGYSFFPTVSGKTWNETLKFSHRTSCEVILSICKHRFYQIRRHKVKKIIVQNLPFFSDWFSQGLWPLCLFFVVASDDKRLFSRKNVQTTGFSKFFPPASQKSPFFFVPFRPPPPARIPACFRQGSRYLCAYKAPFLAVFLLIISAQSVIKNQSNLRVAIDKNRTI